MSKQRGNPMPQAPLPFSDGDQNFEGAFRKLYYHLYSNSEATRAERILSDLALLLLWKLASETRPSDSATVELRTPSGDPNAILLPLLRKAYPQLVGDQDRFSLGSRAISIALEDMQEITLSSAPAHVLGDAFQALMGPRLRGDKGQFFTPRSLVRAMVDVIDPKPEESILDPASGTGSFLAETHVAQTRSGAARLTGRLVGVDKDHDMFRLSSALLEIATRGRAKVYNFNSLDSFNWRDYFESEMEGCFDVVLTNPPFGARIGITQPQILDQFSFGHQWTQPRLGGDWDQTGRLLPTQDPQVLFLELCVRKLKPGGRLGIVLPEGLFGNKNTSYVWDWLDKHGRVFALLDCPRTAFQPGTDTKTNVLFFQKGDGTRRPEPGRGKVYIAVALNCGHDRRGRTRRNNGTAYPDDFKIIGREYKSSPVARQYWRQTDLKGSHYLVPRYYEEQKPLSPQEAELTRGATFASLEELIEREWLQVRKGHEPGSEAYGTGDIPFVRTSDLSNFEIKTDPTNAVSEEVYQQFATQQNLQPGNVLMVVDGRYRIGTTAILTDGNFRCVVQSHLRILSTLEPDRLSPFALLYALNLPSVRRRIRDLVFVQSTLGTLGKRLYELRIPIFHADGPWTDRIAEFRYALEQRDKLLTRLRAATEGPEFEL